MTLPDDRIFSLLKDEFVLVYHDIERERHCGDSRGYAKHQTAVSTTNGAGAHNVQMFVLGADRVVLHALPGYWHPEDLLSELRFAQTVHRLWQDENRATLQKEIVYRHLHRQVLEHPDPEMRARSVWQPFDAISESHKPHPARRDVFVLTDTGTLQRDRWGNYVTKPIDQIVHERMSRRPFVPFESFDVASFVDLGQLHYDLNRSYDQGRTFRARARMAEKYAREREREEREERRRRAD